MEEIAAALYASHVLVVDRAKVEKTITTMLERGSYYRNLESVLGAGSTLALGTEINETTYVLAACTFHSTDENSWTRALGKSGKVFNKVTQHLRETSLASLSRRYAELRAHLVSYQLQYLVSRHSLLVQQATMPLNTFDENLWMMDTNSASDAMLNFIDTTAHREHEFWDSGTGVAVYSRH